MKNYSALKQNLKKQVTIWHLKRFGSTFAIETEVKNEV